MLDQDPERVITPEAMWRLVLGGTALLLLSGTAILISKLIGLLFR